MSFDAVPPADWQATRSTASTAGSEPRRILVLGGIRSGKSAFAESLVASDEVRYLATAAAGDDADFSARIAAHQDRRPSSWHTVEAGDDPRLVIDELNSAQPDQTLLVEDLGNWAAAALLGGEPDRAAQAAAIAEFAGAVRDCPAKVVLVSPEVGLSVVPSTTLGARFADQVGSLNQAVAAVCDAVALVVAGQPSWLRTAAPAATPTSAAAAASGVPAAAAIRSTVDEAELPEVVTAAVPAPRPTETSAPATTALADDELVIGPRMQLPIPDDEARAAADKHLALLDVPGAGLGTLARTVKFAAGTQGRAVPAPWTTPRLLLLHGDHEGDIAAGTTPDASARTAEAARRGEGPLGLLAAEHGVTLQVVSAATAGPIEFAEAIDDDAVEVALRLGWRLADDAVDSGVDLIILGSCGAGAEGAAAVVVSSITGAELPALLGRIVSVEGKVDDAAWMLRCAAARDAKHRIRRRVLPGRELLKELGGADLAVAVGIILAATARRTPVLLDGPVGVAAGLLARDFGSQSRLWCALPDFGTNPTTKSGADVLGLTPLLDLGVDLGEGANSLLALPLLNAALTLSATLATLPPVLSAPPEFLTSPDGEPDTEQDDEQRAETTTAPVTEPEADAGTAPSVELEPDLAAVPAEPAVEPESELPTGPVEPAVEPEGEPETDSGKPAATEPRASTVE